MKLFRSLTLAIAFAILMDGRICSQRTFGLVVGSVPQQQETHDRRDRATNTSEKQDPLQIQGEEKLVVVTAMGATVADGERKGSSLQVGDVLSFTDERDAMLLVPSVGGWVRIQDVTAYDDAVKVFDTAIKKDSKNAIAHFGKGKLFVWMASNNRWSYSFDGGVVFAPPSEMLNFAVREFGEAVALEPDNAEFIRSRAQALLKTEDLEDAIADFNRLINLNHGDADAYVMRCRALGLQGNWEQAMEDCNKAIELAPKMPDAYAQRGEIWTGKEELTKAIADYEEAIRLGDTRAHVLRSYAMYQQGMFKECIADLDVVIDAHPEDFDLWFKRGSVYLNLGQFDSAIDDLGKSLSLQPNAGAYGNRGIAWASKGEFSNALKDLSSAIELAPDMAANYLNRGRVYGALGDNSRAADDLTEYIKRQSQDMSAYAMRGIARYFSKQYENAIDDLSKALQAFPDAADLYTFRGSAQNYMAKFDKAIFDFGRAIELDPKMADAYNYRGVARSQIGEFEKSLEDFDKAIQLSPRSPYALSNRAGLLTQLGEFAKAAKDYELAIELTPDNFTVLNNFAWMLATTPDDQVRDGDRAVEIALRACDLGGWGQSMFLDTLAAAFAESGDFESAVEWQAKAIELEPENSDGQKARLELYRNQKPYRAEVQSKR